MLHGLMQSSRQLLTVIHGKGDRMKSTTKGRLAALLTATSVATGIAGGFASQAQAAGTPAASYRGQQPERASTSDGGHHHTGKPSGCGPKTFIGNQNISNHQVFLPILDIILAPSDQDNQDNECGGGAVTAP